MILEKILPWANVAYIIVVALGSYGIYQLNALVNANKDRELTRYQSDAGVQIEQAKTKALEAEARAAEANERAEQAQLELAKLKQPRTISNDQREFIVRNLRDFAGQPFGFSAYSDPEAHGFVIQLDAVLKSAGWVRVPSQIGAIEYDVAGDTVGAAAGSGLSAFIGTDNEEAELALRSLSGAFRLAGIQCTYKKTEQLAGKEPKAIIIHVGKKPVD